MAGSRRTRSTENAFQLQSSFHNHPFLDPPSISGVSLEKRIDVAAYWLVRYHLQIGRPISRTFNDNTIRLTVSEHSGKMHWSYEDSDPHMVICFLDELIHFTSDGWMSDRVIFNKVEYCDPEMLDKTIEIIRKWYKCLQVAQCPYAVGDPKVVIYGHS